MLNSIQSETASGRLEQRHAGGWAVCFLKY
jgi:hypothetical protein